MKKISFYNIFRPEYLYLLFAIIFGFAYLITIPPASYDDAIIHSNRTMEIASGGFVTRTQIPASMDKVANYFDSKFRILLKIDWKKNGNSWEAEEPEKLKDLYKDGDIAKQYEIDLEKDKTIDTATATAETMFYSPVPYIPQAIGYFLAYQLGLKPLAIIYIGSLFAMFTCIAITFYALKKCPILKWQMFLVALFPLAVFYNPTVSADPFTNAISFLYFSLVVSAAMQKDNITSKQIIALSVAAFLLCMSKGAYFPVTLIALLIPAKKFPDKKAFVKSMLIIILPGVLSGLFWMYWSNIEYAHLITWRKEGVDATAQMAYILDNPIKFFTLSLKTIPLEIITKIPLLISNPIQALYTLQFLIFFFTLVVAREKEGNFIQIKLWQRLMLVAISGLIVCATYLFLYLTYNPVKIDEILGFRERYLIPLVPLILLATISTKPLKSPYHPVIVKVGIILLVSSTFISLYLLLSGFILRYYANII